MSVWIYGECNRITGVYIYAVKLLSRELFFVVVVVVAIAHLKHSDTHTHTY